MFPHATCMLWNPTKSSRAWRGFVDNDWVQMANDGFPVRFLVLENVIPDVATMETTDNSNYKRLISTTSNTIPSTGSTTIALTTMATTVTTTPYQPARRMSDQDRPLFEALIADEYSENPRRRHACTGRFLTMHKRRRKKLNTRSLVLDQAILDDILHGQVQCILDRVGNWRFNAFTLETVTGGRSLPVLCVHLFHWYGLLDHFNLDVVRVWKLFSLIEEGYHSTNPYHNSIHATDVTQAMHCFLQERRILENLSPLEIMASLIGAVTHDLDHPGVNQPFLIATSNHLAALYENTSVLENHHWRSAVGCLLESGVAEQIQGIRPELEKQISSLILATDITRQQEFIATFRDYLCRDKLDMRDKEHRHFILQIALKCADISNPCRPWDISKKWSMKVCEEFFRQGDYERQLNLPVTSLCDRQSTSVPKIQTGFFKFVVTPLLDEWHRFLKTELSHSMMHHLKFNQAQWECKLQAEINEETRTEISDAELLEEEDPEESDDQEEPVLDLSDSSEVLIPNFSKFERRGSLQIPGFCSVRSERRFSVPVHSIPKIVLPVRDHRASNHPPESIQESDEHKFDNDSLSIFSSDSDSLHRGGRGSSTGSTADRERPLSAENLLPDCSIASMTAGICGDRLNLMLHGTASIGNTANLLTVGTSKHLIRQQTFPPLQPYIRTRYMSSQAELGACPEALLESNSSSSSSNSHPGTNSESRGILMIKKESIKRETDSSGSADKAKIPKLSLGQKENLDPSMLKRSLSRRRGSAPVTVALPPKSTESDLGVSLVIKGCDLRRGSMPAEFMSTMQTKDQPHGTQPEAPTLPNNIGPVYNMQRRGSVPCESSNSVVIRSSFSIKRRSTKKALRRRSSGGAEILSPILSEDTSGAAPGSSSSSSSAWQRFKRRTDTDNLLSRRRGSLPVEVLTIGYSGTLRH
ncbi:cGMP-inhibited 3',5'-cyclic phosphodiesterase 3B-like isoform X2 [Topomyia yanbarensis]|uniref:cGMP-inhibited 3',5'-cyclic phosphodiesterase 3B-like isoform X2 n=1 Tax=Topomyia yanbarensis TaxID=2498891 RepID=UPI00273B99E4|nr:cGMP-inhibited 3',5'-cyclic phosphodiesterase 3B-like isoform X2 [Topomyia yanbarensis]